MRIVSRFGLGFFSIAFIVLSFLFSAPVKASDCVTTYGATCPSKQIFIEKKVQNPKTGEMVNVLSSTDATFAPDNEINFRIEVKNTGTADLSNISVKDQLPSSLNYISSTPSGSFDANNNTLNWTIDNLGRDQSRFFQIKAQVKPQRDLNFDMSCVTNFVEAKVDDQHAQANAAFCIQTQVTPAPVVTEMPRTGIPAVAWALSATLFFTGFKLRKFANSKKTQEFNPNYICQKRKILKGGE